MDYTDKERKDDFQWFLDNYDDLYMEYGESYLAIQNHRVLGSYESVGEGTRETEKITPIGTFIIQHCNGNETGYTNYFTSVNFMGARG